MPFARRTTALRGTSSRKSSRRRPVKKTTKIRYQPPTARNQKTQIMANARAISRNAKALYRHKVYCDWQISGTGSPAAFANWQVQPLVNPINWNGVLRQDQNVLESSHTFLKRLQLNMRFELGQKDNCYFNVFIVTLRKNFSGLDPMLEDAMGTAGDLWIEPTSTQGANIRLNSGVFKVHYSKYVSLTENTMGQAAKDGLAGNPYSTWRKCQVDLPLNMSLTYPLIGTTANSWKALAVSDIPYYHRYYMLTYMAGEGSGTLFPFMGYDCLYTTINTD